MYYNYVFDFEDTTESKSSESTSYKSATIALAVLLVIVLVGVLALGAVVLYRRDGFSKYTIYPTYM